MHPPLASVHLWHYRCFVDFDLQLRPLTLLYGRNGVGKSTLVRLFPLIEQAVGEKAAAPLDPSSEAGGKARFAEFEWKGKTSDEETGFELGLRWHDATLAEARWHIDVDGHGRPHIRRLTLHRPDGRIYTTLDMTPRGAHVTDDTDRRPIEVRFVGLRPQSAHAGLRTLDERLEGLRGALRWLSTGRRMMPRVFDPDLPVAEIDLYGDGALQMAAGDADLLASARDWFQRPPIRRRLRMGAQGQLARPLVEPLMADTSDPLPFDIELADAGSGLNHVFPLLVAARLAERDGALLAVEEPESHLHTDAQRSLAEWICERIQGDDPPRLVLETHSEVMIRAVQLAIARTPALSDRVGAYWLGQNPDGSTHAPLVTFDELGRPEGTGWPRNAFADDRALALELARLRMQGDAGR